MQSIVLLLGFAMLSNMAIASPLEARQSKCHPNFEGVGVSVVWSQQGPHRIREWVPGNVNSSFGTAIDDYQQAAEFRFEQTGTPRPTYIAKKLGVPANNVVVGVGNNNDLSMKYLSAKDPNQKWAISCDMCSTDAWSFQGAFATNCEIKSVNLGLCVQVETSPPRANSSPSYALQLAPCSGASNQIHDFWMV